jgi:SAM-dependent methyltransferase
VTSVGSEEKRVENLSGFYRDQGGGYLDFDATLQRLRYRAFKEQFRGVSCLEIAPARGITTELMKEDFEVLDVVDGSKNLLDDIPTYSNVRKFHSLIERFTPDRTYDTIVMDHILEHIEEPVACLSRVRGWLSPGGVLIVGVPNAKSFHRQAGVKMGLLESIYELNSRDLELGHFRVYDFESLRSHVTSAGLRVIGEDGVFLKFLTNRQCQDTLDESQVEAYFQLSREFTDLSAEIFVYCESASADRT